jgi:hypothetical protein
MNRAYRVLIATTTVATLLAGCCSLVAVAAQGSPDIPPHSEAIVLFNGTSLDNFDSFLKTKGLNNDPDHVFRLENGVIHISGAEFGYLITKREQLCTVSEIPASRTSGIAAPRGSRRF